MVQNINLKKLIILYKFKNVSEAEFVKGDIFGGEVEYEGEIYKFRYYDEFDEAEPYEEASVLISVHGKTTISFVI